MTLRLAASILALALAGPTLAGCGSNDPATCDPGGELVKTDVTVGTGSAVATVNSTVTVRYVGTLADGTVFDRNETATFNLGGTIPGFRLGIDGMKIGGRRTIVVPPNLGYGASPPSGIPPCATLTFDVTLLDVR